MKHVPERGTCKITVNGCCDSNAPYPGPGRFERWLDGDSASGEGSIPGWFRLRGHLNPERVRSRRRSARPGVVLVLLPSLVQIFFPSGGLISVPRSTRTKLGSHSLPTDHCRAPDYLKATGSRVRRIQPPRRSHFLSRCVALPRALSLFSFTTTTFVRDELRPIRYHEPTSTPAKAIHQPSLCRYRRQTIHVPRQLLWWFASIAHIPLHTTTLHRPPLDRT